MKNAVFFTISPFYYIISYNFAEVFNFKFIMNQGKVKFFNESKGYGFIKDTDTEKEYFVHVSGLIDEVKDEDDVTFELSEGRKGLNAVNVRLA
jgi:CspA family cold shock protein